MAGTKRYSSIVNTSDAYRISTDPAQLDLVLIHRFLSQESYWAQNVRQFGFTVPKHPEVLVEKHDPNVYRAASS